MPASCTNLKKNEKLRQPELSGTTKSDRSAVDALTPIGMGATDTTGRLAASIFGMCPTEPFFEPCLDIAGGGVLLGLPGLLSMGLLSHSELFTLPPGYYRLDSIFMLLAFMAFARIKTIESLRYCPPGEWGKLLGLDSGSKDPPGKGPFTGSGREG